MDNTPQEAGKSSFALADTGKLTAALALEPGQSVLDLGCGSGAYTLLLAGLVGPTGKVHGIDLWSDGVAQLKSNAAREGLSNITAEVGDIKTLANIEDNTYDTVFIATVMHDLAERGEAHAAATAATTKLKPGGTLAIVEFKKQNSKPGPPIEIRLGPEDLDAILRGVISTPSLTAGLGEHLYIAKYRK